ncbi:MAG: hypothetical protein EOP83_20015 [Verrucomicrobiaceae bacterium]|nr:MAG: hypothetical protein EOP83_20015 [Verrucomicrobiaceae bacterium]
MMHTNPEREVTSEVAMPIVSKLIDEAIGILRQNPSADPHVHQLVITRVLGEYNDTQGKYHAEIAHLEVGEDNGQFSLGVALTHRYLN